MLGQSFMVGLFGFRNVQFFALLLALDSIDNVALFVSCPLGVQVFV